LISQRSIEEGFLPSSSPMAYTELEGREGLLDGMERATDRIGVALGALSAAYERVDEQTADRLEEKLFGPVQQAYGKAKRTLAEFAGRHDIPPRTLNPPEEPPTSADTRELIQSAGRAAVEADQELAGVQDERWFVEVGDAELRSGLAEVRAALASVPQQAALMLRTLGR
jgi:hypothetical protein